MSDAIHEFFGLSYANYLVVPRSVLQSMPDEWQDKFVAMLRELDALEQFEAPGGYRVQAIDWSGRVIRDPFSDYERGRRRIPLRFPDEQLIGAD